MGWVHNLFVLSMTAVLGLGLAGWVGGELTQSPSGFNLAPTFRFFFAAAKSAQGASAPGDDFDYSKPLSDVARESGGVLQEEVGGALRSYAGEDSSSAEQPASPQPQEQVDNRLLACPDSSVNNKETRISHQKALEMKSLWEGGQLRMTSLIEIQSVWGEPNCIIGKRWRFLSDDGLGTVDVIDNEGSLSFEFSNF